ncbi:MAG: aspartyl-phosphate phosphatase Spo0E family protein [Clostridia bacterium]|nr:aspartyl-phosphate phosphatase Spo0E family protein [Clostridia bacterium]
MIKEKIETLKEELNELVKNEANFDEIYRVSKQIDKYLVEYYKGI